MHYQVAKRNKATKEFELIRFDKECTFINIAANDTWVSLEISRKQWNNLITLLKRSQTKRFLVAGASGYRMLIIDKCDFDYYNLEFHLKKLSTAGELSETDLAQGKKKLTVARNYAKDVEKFHLDKRVGLFFPSKKTCVYLTRNKFVSFRNYILRLHR